MFVNFAVSWGGGGLEGVGRGGVDRRTGPFRFAPSTSSKLWG